MGDTRRQDQQMAGNTEQVKTEMVENGQHGFGERTELTTAKQDVSAKQPCSCSARRSSARAHSRASAAPAHTSRRFDPRSQSPAPEPTCSSSPDHSPTSCKLWIFSQNIVRLHLVLCPGSPLNESWGCSAPILGPIQRNTTRRQHVEKTRLCSTNWVNIWY